jgi:hypothetical protein
MHTDKELNAATTERLGEQGGLLLRTYIAAFARDSDSDATKSWRSNLTASISMDVTNALGFTDLYAESNKQPTNCASNLLQSAWNCFACVRRARVWSKLIRSRTEHCSMLSSNL